MGIIFLQIAFHWKTILTQQPNRAIFANRCSRPRPRLGGMNRLAEAFTEHPRSVGESYWQHMGASLSFSGQLLLAGLAALVHSVLPFMLVKTGSRMVSRLHDRMVANRVRASQSA